jgi:hypothetical protein
MQWVQLFEHCWKHLQKSCIFNSASGACSCFWILIMSEFWKKKGVTWKFWMFLKLKALKHTDIIRLLLVSQQLHKLCSSAFHAQFLCQIILAWLRWDFPIISQIQIMILLSSLTSSQIHTFSSTLRVNGYPAYWTSLTGTTSLKLENKYNVRVLLVVSCLKVCMYVRTRVGQRLALASWSLMICCASPFD